ncbi:hypothetical protein ACHFI2_05970 [Exiguobacterium acetylicum]|uniref:hypothetical protein n=1 Tax=Exiguobacterium acetylicum TaxID=41170 RepID=UPI003876298B
MKRLNILLDLALIGIGIYMTMEIPEMKMLGIVLILAGIASRITAVSFSQDEPYDERQNEVKIRSGHIAYLISIGYLYLILVLVNLSVIQDIQFALLLALGGQILFFPIALWFVNRRI